jgi:hypothetical protein
MLLAKSVKTFPSSISENEQRKPSMFKHEKLQEKLQILTAIKWNIQRVILEFVTN